ncbi:MAG: BspA family leucine-rich repeat surface protein [Sphaerochaeta sp.]
MLFVVLCLTSCEDSSALTGEVEIYTEGDVRQIHLNEDSLSVSLSYPDDSSVSIRYTTDESDVTDTSSLYSGPFNISADTTVKAKAFRDSGVASTLSERRYYKVTEEFSDKGLLQDRLIELIADDELGPEGDYNHIGLDSSLADLSSLFDNEFLQTFNGDISAWDVSDVSNMSCMFKGAQSFNQPLNDWDVSNVISMDRMFGVAILFNQPLNDWDVCNVESMNSMFAENYSFNQPLNDWDVSNVLNMDMMFCLANTFNQDISSWKLNSLEVATHMFSSNESFDQDLTGWNDDLPDSVIEYDGIIENCSNMDTTKLPIKLGGSTT